MAENSKIEWCDHTFNPWIGCAKVSEGCKNCYAEKQQADRYKRVVWGPQGTRSRTSAAYWILPLKWNKEAENTGIRPKVFCGSLCDIFEDRADLVEWRRELLELIQATPNIDWLLLTKRPENVKSMVEEGVGVGYSYQWFYSNPHVWIGTSVENQVMAKERIPHLMKIPALMLFLSVEPMLGPVNLFDVVVSWAIVSSSIEFSLQDYVGGGFEFPIDWVICGGETGPGARPMEKDWARSLRDECYRVKVPFFFKQWGRWNSTYEPVGKKRAGRILDGRTWDQFPD